MEFKELNMKAYVHGGVDKFWDLPTRHAYLQLENLYDKFSMKKINKEKSIIEKNKIEKEYKENKDEYQKYINVFVEYNENRKINTQNLIKIEKSKDIHEILETSLNIIANYIDDDDFVERIIKKIKE